MLYAIIGVLVIIADQAVKYLSLARVGMLGDVVPLIPNVISLVYVENKGAAFGFLAGSNARIFFIILTAVFTLAVIIALATRFISGGLSRWCMVLVTAGGLSNCIDRVIYGYVQDMFKVELFNFAVFNLADVFITVFCFLFILCILFGGEKDRSVAEYDEFDDEDDDEEEEKKPLFGRIARGRDDDDYDEPRRGKKSKRRAIDDGEEPRGQRSPAAEGAAQRSRRSETSVAGVQRAQSIQRSQGPRPGMPRTPAPAPAKIPSAPTGNTADPFAEWEKANARVTGQSSAAAKAMGVAPVKPPVQQPAQPPMQRPIAPPVQAPVQAPVKPVARPSGASRASSDFDLDDILNEFK